MEGGKVGIKIDFINKTVENTSSTPITLKEYIEKVTTIEPGETVTLDPNTKTIEF